MLSINAYAESDKVFKLKKPVMCSDVATLLQALQHGMNMRPVFTSLPEKGRSTTYILLAGLGDNKWAVVETDNEIACLVAEGMTRISSISSKREYD